MYVLRIEHSVPSYQSWKQAFDSDPVNRKKMGVRHFRIYRAVDNKNNVLLDLEFDSEDQANALLGALKTLWGRVEGTLMSDVRTRILEQVEESTL